MENFFNKIGVKNLLKKNGKDFNKNFYEKQVTILYGMLGNIYGSKEMVLKASQLGVLQELQSEEIYKKLYALLVVANGKKDNVEMIYEEDEIPEYISEIENKIAEILSYKTVEAEINKKVNELMEKKHTEFIKEMKKKILSDESGPETEFTENKYNNLEKLENRYNLKTIMEILRPKDISEIIGQEKAIKSLLTKLATPYPQHVILYGPPGVGKTTAARLVLDIVKNIKYTPFSEESPFIEVDGTTLRWDPRDMANPLIGSVHDPIYQGAQKDFAGDGIPEPKPGLVTDAHGGVLFIDEIGEMDAQYQSKLLKVLEDKRVNFESAYYDSENPKIPKYIKKLFKDGAPADFVLIGATTRTPNEINPAIRSRVAEVYFQPLTMKNIENIVEIAAKKLDIKISEDAKKLIANYTIEGRKAINILSDVYSSILYSLKDEDEVTNIKIEKIDVENVIKINRLNPIISKKGDDSQKVGRVFGLGVSSYMGSLIEFEGIKFEAEKGKGNVRFNETAGSMAKDSLFNALTVARAITKKDVKNYDIHINIIGGGKVDGPSAGAAITALIVSILDDRPIRQDVALTGEISIQGEIKPIGGVVEKIYGAIQGNMKKVLIPYENRKDVPKDVEIEVVIVKSIDDVIRELM
ncbi:Lon family ATP-dependent protease [Haliovirga abyssi]|uniref:endopeptidase La n=1 Tax=Haliovirga abyssi TaxID=2996794 RepID=A0AAU9DFI3_9FUSO|nr:Lon family ATP-dependent protease [Haliovirga abyssi]BDU50963.1 ATP-dependent protease [Haliovirga abyssi]